MDGFEPRSGASSRPDARIPSLYTPVVRRLWPAILEVAAAYPVPPTLLLTLCWTESGFELDAIAPDGGLGLLSMTPHLARSLAPRLGLTGLPCLQNPGLALRLGAVHLVDLLAACPSLPLALLAWRVGVAVALSDGPALLQLPAHADWIDQVLTILAWVEKAQPWRAPSQPVNARFDTHAEATLARWLRRS